MQERGGDASQYASSQVVATSHPRELGSTGPDTGLAAKLAGKAHQDALHISATTNGTH